MHFFCSTEGGKFVGCRLESLRDRSREQGPGHATVQFTPSILHPVLPHFGPLLALQSHPISPTPLSPTSCPPHTLHPAYSQQDRSHQGHSNCSFTFWKNKTPKCRNWQNQRADGLALPGSHRTPGSGPSPGSTSPLSGHRECPHLSSHKSSCQGLYHFYYRSFCSRTSQIMRKREWPTEAILHQ